MGSLLSFWGATGVLVLAGITVHWTHVASKTYPYTISRPTSFRLAVVKDATNTNVDYYFPPLGSRTTNVNISAPFGTRARDEAAYLRSIGGRNVRNGPRMKLAGKIRTLCTAHFSGLVGPYTLEQTNFVARSRVWWLTISYEDRYRGMRPLLEKMLRSFRLH